MMTLSGMLDKDVVLNMAQSGPIHRLTTKKGSHFWGLWVGLSEVSQIENRTYLRITAAGCSHWTSGTPVLVLFNPKLQQWHCALYGEGKFAYLVEDPTADQVPVAFLGKAGATPLQKST